MAAPTAVIERGAPRPARPLGEHLGGAAFVVAIITGVTLVVIAALAASRADGHAVSPAAVIGIVVGVAMALGGLRWADALYSGADDVQEGRALLTCAPGCTGEPTSDPWKPRPLWRGVVIATVATGLWAGAAAGLVAVVLDQGRAPFLVLAATLVGTTAIATAVVDVVGRHRGAHGTRAPAVLDASPTPLRRRAWREIALPLGASQFAVNAAAAWLLFHDYHAAVGPHALTGAVVTADFPVVAIIVAVYFGMTATRWGRVDARLGRIELDDPGAQAIDRRAPVGAQGLVYLVVATVLAGNVVAWFVPGRPSLMVVALVRGLFAALATTVAAGAGFVRGAVNA